MNPVLEMNLTAFSEAGSDSGDEFDEADLPHAVEGGFTSAISPQSESDHPKGDLNSFEVVKPGGPHVDRLAAAAAHLKKLASHRFRRRRAQANRGHSGQAPHRHLQSPRAVSGHAGRFLESRAALMRKAASMGRRVRLSTQALTRRKYVSAFSGQSRAGRLRLVCTARLGMETEWPTMPPGRQ